MFPVASARLAGAIVAGFEELGAALAMATRLTAAEKKAQDLAVLEKVAAEARALQAAPATTSGVLKSAQSSDELVTIYRGVTEGHPGYRAALEGKAIPRGGHSDPVLHNMGDTESVFTSWTTDRSMADFFATKYGGPGVRLELTVPQSRVGWSPNVHQEAEVLLKGPVSGAKVEHVVPR